MDILINNPHFRKGTSTKKRDYLFQLDGALGDMICWMAAIIWVAKNYNYLNGHVVVPYWFVPLAKRMIGFSDWTVWPEIPVQFSSGFEIRRNVDYPINATTGHLIDLGFMYYAGMYPPPEDGRFYPEIKNLQDVKSFDLPEKYMVFTPGATADNRKLSPGAFNMMTAHAIKCGYTPVYLGKKLMAGSRYIGLDSGYDLSNGVDLLDKTTLSEAVKILSSARLVVGLDNGLLHLAACTDVPILFAYTIAGPKQRRPLRKYGHVFELYPDETALSCVFCQENVRFFQDHNFKTCIYKEKTPACVKMLNGESFCGTIDMALDVLEREETHGKE